MSYYPGATLALLEVAPDRETAQVMLLAAVHDGASPQQMQLSWRRWEKNNERARRSGQ